jgi:hypothetical protein
MDSKTLGRFRQHHRMITSRARGVNVKRGKQFQAWAYGRMIPIGSRQPQGGCPGDSYAAYAHMVKDSEDDLDMIFGHALVSITHSGGHHLLTMMCVQDAETMNEIVNGAVSGYHDARVKQSIEAQLNLLGSIGINLYYCLNYMSPQHRDRDASHWSACCQLWKDMNGPDGSTDRVPIPNDEFNFAFTEWGVYIETQVKCLW